MIHEQEKISIYKFLFSRPSESLKKNHGYDHKKFIIYLQTEKRGVKKFFFSPNEPIYLCFKVRFPITLEVYANNCDGSVTVKLIMTTSKKEEEK